MSNYSFSTDVSAPLKKKRSIFEAWDCFEMKDYEHPLILCNRTRKETDVSQISQHQRHRRGFVTTSVVREVTMVDPCLWEGRWYPGLLLGEARWMRKEVRGRQTASGQFVWDSCEAIPVHKAFLMGTS